MYRVVNYATESIIGTYETEAEAYANCFGPCCYVDSDQ